MMNSMEFILKLVCDQDETTILLNMGGIFYVFLTLTICIPRTSETMIDRNLCGPLSSDQSYEMHNRGRYQGLIIGIPARRHQ